MTKQPEALRLADSIEDIQGLNTIDGTLVDHAARELRRLHESNVELQVSLKNTADLLQVWIAAAPPYVNAETHREVLRTARAAIAKAEGETE